MKYKGSFITFEGGEGAGKSTLIKRLSKELIKEGRDVLSTREPGGSSLGLQIRNWLLNPHEPRFLFPKAELMLFLADRAQHIEETILPALEKGTIILCDRFNDSTVAYQGYGRGLGVDFVQSLCDLVCGNFVPDLTLLLDIDPKIGLLRTRNSNKDHSKVGEMDRIESEKLEFHEKLRQGFKELLIKYPERITLVDASLAESAVFKQALQIVQERLIST